MPRNHYTEAIRRFVGGGFACRPLPGRVRLSDTACHVAEEEAGSRIIKAILFSRVTRGISYRLGQSGRGDGFARPAGYDTHWRSAPTSNIDCEGADIQARVN